MAFGLCGNNLILYSMKPFGESSESHTQIDDDLLTWAASIGAILNGISRLVFGTLIDKYSFRVLMGIILAFELAICIAFYFSAHSPSFYFALVLITYALIGGFFVILPVSITRTFGLKLGP